MQGTVRIRQSALLTAILASSLLSTHSSLAADAVVSGSKCVSAVTTSISSNATRFDLNKTIYPPSVVQFLRANPAYVKLYPQFPTIEEAYIKGRVQSDWETYKNHIPSHATAILDIGSGIGGIDLLLYHTLETPHLTLVDKAYREQEGVTYSVTQSAREFLTSNGVADSKLRVLDAADSQLQAKLRTSTYDSIFSLRGLGYMFPYSIYHGLVVSQLRVGGVLILDLTTRSATDLSSAPVIGQRFQNDGFPSPEEVMGTLRSSIGEPEIIGKGTDYVRVKVVRTIPAQP